MRFFTCVFPTDGGSVPATRLGAYETLPRTRGVPFQWQYVDRTAVLMGGDDDGPGARIERHGQWIAVGTVRLDNRADLERWIGKGASPDSDLGVVLQVVAHLGIQRIPDMLGDFAFVAWEAPGTTVIAACDTFAVRRLYYADRDGAVAFSSRADALVLEEQYEPQYLIELLALCGPSPEMTVYRGIRPVPAASIAMLDHGRLTVRKYWEAVDFEAVPTWAKSEREAVDTCRALLSDAVRVRLGDRGETWAQLSGGLDSSSVVSTAEWLAEHGLTPHRLAGTVTYVDRAGSGVDERPYSNSVVQRWSVRNETIVDSPTWYEEGAVVPPPEQPRFDLQFYPRDRRLGDIVRSAGGRVLLTGWGGDELFMGTMIYFADWLVQGRAWRAIREMVRIAAIGRASFWELAFMNAIVPLLPTVIRRWALEDESLSQPWLKLSKRQQREMVLRTHVSLEGDGRIGRKYRHAAATKVAGLAGTSNRDALSEFLDVRHPFLHRPLVEFALCLPPTLRARPYAHRWVLREAMRGILPDKVRTRVGKPGTGEALAWSLATNRASLARLLRAPILADLGIVDADKLRDAFAGTTPRTHRDAYIEVTLHSTLAVEAWLQMRSGRWPGESPVARKGRLTHDHFALS